MFFSCIFNVYKRVVQYIPALINKDLHPYSKQWDKQLNQILDGIEDGTLHAVFWQSSGQIRVKKLGTVDNWTVIIHHLDHIENTATLEEIKNEYIRYDFKLRPKFTTILRLDKIVSRHNNTLASERTKQIMSVYENVDEVLFK